MSSIENLIQTAFVWALPMLLAITLHEAAHAFAAYKLGDNTAKMMGRLTLNPIKHIDVLGTIIIPAVLLVMGSSFIFGYAKPVPVNFGQLRNIRRDTAIVALAGPVANLLMAFLWALGKLGMLYMGNYNLFILNMLEAGIMVNLVLFAFNLFPLPPLDGGRIMTSLLPPQLAMKFEQVERYGFFIVMGLIYLGLTNYWLSPVMFFGRWLINLFLYPFIYFLS